MSRNSVLGALVAVLVVTGCGTSNGISREELARSIVQVTQRRAEQARTEVQPKLRRFDEKAGVEYSAPGPRTARLHDSEACQDASAKALAPTGETTIYECYVETGEIGAPRAKWWINDVGIYSIEGQCWKGAIIGTATGFGTPEYGNIPSAQSEIDEAGDHLHGCIGQKKEVTSRTPSEEGRSEEPAVVAAPGKRPSVEPNRIEISEGSYPLILSRIHWDAWGKQLARGRGTLEVVNCEPDCAGGKYEARGSVRINLGGADGKCGRVLYRSITFMSSTTPGGPYRLSCSGVAKGTS